MFVFYDKHANRRTALKAGQMLVVVCTALYSSCVDIDKLTHAVECEQMRIYLNNYDKYLKYIIFDKIMFFKRNLG